MTVLEKSIISTLSWFDLYQQPLTSYECWYYLWSEAGQSQSIACTQSEAITSLLTLVDKGKVRLERGFWQLADSPSYVALRLERARYAISKRKRAQAATKLIKHLPFIKMVALVNTLALEVADKDSDIDLLIIVKQGRVYLGRLLVTALMQILGWRRHGHLVRDRICLSFYLGDDHLNIQALSYKDDPYLAYWLASLQPLGGVISWDDLIRANDWIFRFLPNCRSLANQATIKEQSSFGQRLWEKLLAKRLGDVLEYLARRFQLFFINHHSQSRLGDGSTAVVVNNSVLKFHENDQRLVLAAKFRARQKQAGGS